MCLFELMIYLYLPYCSLYSRTKALFVALFQNTRVIQSFFQNSDNSNSLSICRIIVACTSLSLIFSYHITSIILSGDLSYLFLKLTFLNISKTLIQKPSKNHHNLDIIFSQKSFIHTFWNIDIFSFFGVKNIQGTLEF